MVRKLLTSIGMSSKVSRKHDFSRRLLIERLGYCKNRKYIIKNKLNIRKITILQASYELLVNEG